MIIAFCSNFDGYNSNKILSYEYAMNYPGTAWIYFLAQLMKKYGHEVLTGDIAISNIKDKKYTPSDVLVIQELNARHAQQLIKLGARSFLLTGFESPLIAWHFFDKLSKMAPKFNNRILFSGAFDLFKSDYGDNYQMTFPNYCEGDIKPLVDIANRKFMVIVAANKYPKEQFRLPNTDNLSGYPFWLAVRLIGRLSKTKRNALNSELNLKRVELIDYFGSKDLLDLYGTRWELTDVLPENIENNVRATIDKLAPKKCLNKIETISRYKFAICFENVQYKGYITEKIIDCFVAGVIPVYLGAPDIEKYIPKEAFIDFRNFDSLHDLEDYLKRMTIERMKEMITAGRNFIESEAGKKYSYEGFAGFIEGLVLREV